MESTGKYWVPVLNVLEDEINVTIANPKWVSAVNKTLFAIRSSPESITLTRKNLLTA